MEVDVGINNSFVKSNGNGAMKIKQRVESDVALKHILLSMVGTPPQDFRDGLLYDSTIESLRDLWSRLDYVHQGVLHQRDFESARGVESFGPKYRGRV